MGRIARKGTSRGLLRNVPSAAQLSRLLTPIDVSLRPAVALDSTNTNSDSVLANNVTYAFDPQSTRTTGGWFGHTATPTDPGGNGSDVFTIRGGPRRNITYGSSLYDMFLAGYYGAAEAATVTVIDFLYDGDVFEICAGAWIGNMLIDGQLVFPTAQGFSYGGDKWSRFTFPDARDRHITLLLNGGPGLRGIAVPRAYRIRKAPVQIGPRIAAFGDSFLGHNTAEGGMTIPLAVGRRLGWWDIWSSGMGGTGYVNTNAGAYQAIGGSNRLGSLMTAKPDAYLFMGGINDPYAGLQAAALGCFQQIRAADVRAPIVVVGPFYPSTSQAALQAQAGQNKVQALKGAVASVSGPWLFIDNFTGGWTSDRSSRVGGGPWLAGEGKIGSTTGIGDADRKTNSDGTHPSPVQVADIGARTAEAILAAWSNDERVA